jgi:hypothetical protein
MEICRITVQGQPEDKGRKTPSQSIVGCAMHVYHHSYAGDLNSRIEVHAGQGIN